MALAPTMQAQEVSDILSVDHKKHEFEPHAELGIIGGPTWNQYDITPLYTHHYFDESYTLGFDFGASFLWQQKEWIGIRSDLALINKSHTFSYYGFSITGINNLYIQLPVMVDFSWSINKFRIHTDLGFFFGCFATSYHAGAFAVFDSDGSRQYDYSYFESDRRSTKRFEIGYVATLGVSYRLCEHFRLLAEGALFYGLSDTHDASPVSPNPAYNTTLGINLGLYWVL